MDLYQTRRERLNLLVAQQFSGVAYRLAAHLELDPVQVYRLLGRSNRTSNCGQVLARRIEQACHLPSGWLDTPSNATEPSARLAAIITALQQAEQMPDSATLLDGIESMLQLWQRATVKPTTD